MVAPIGSLVTQVNTFTAGAVNCPVAAARMAGMYRSMAYLNSVPCCAALPDATLNAGRFFYIEDLKIYRYSDGTQWTNDYQITDKQLWGWGANYKGQTGVGFFSALNDGIFSPIREVCSATNWLEIGVGYNHSRSIKKDGSLWSWGTNGAGQLGRGDVACSVSPVREFCSASDWCAVSTGPTGAFGLAIKTSGSLWGWGYNDFGQLGVGDKTNRCSPIREFCSAANWNMVANGSLHAAAIKTDGSLWSWGYGGQGRLGTGSNTESLSPVREFCSATNWCQLSIGNERTFAVKTDGSMWAWGAGTVAGSIGDANILNRSSPVSLCAGSTDWCWVSGGSTHSLAVKKNGTLWSWGCNAGGILGIGNVANRCTPTQEFCGATNWCQVAAGHQHSLGLKTDGTLWVWGENFVGALGIAGSNSHRCSPVREVCAFTNWQWVVANRHSLGLRIV